MLNPQQPDTQPFSEESPGGDSEQARPRRDPNDSAEALSPIEKRLRKFTYRLTDLNVLFGESAGETPGREILQTEFYFGRPVIRSAVIHRCASEGDRQYATAWLFEPAEPDPNVHLPAGEVTVSADGKVYVSAGCPIEYPFRAQARTVSRSNSRATLRAPETGARRTISRPSAGASMSAPMRRRVRLVWVPLVLMVIIAGSVVAYRNLIAPEPITSETAAARLEGEPLTVVAVEHENWIEPEFNAGTPEPPALSQTEAPVRLESEPATSERQPAASARHRAAPERSATAPRPRLSDGKVAASERQGKGQADAGRPPPQRPSAAVVAMQASPSRAPTVAAAPTANVPSPAVADPPIGATPGGGLETTQPVAKEPPARPVIAREEQPAPATAVQRQRQQVAVENTWLTRMRAELVVCGKPGFWRNDICREVTRWRYCHPDRWHTVAECAVGSFP